MSPRGFFGFGDGQLTVLLYLLHNNIKIQVVPLIALRESECGSNTYVCT